MAEEDYRKAVFKSLKYTPTEAQQRIHDSDARIKLVAGGERGGKSHTGAKETLLHALRSELIWIVGPEYDIARTEYYYLLDDLIKLNALKRSSDAKQGPLDMETITGCKIVTKSAKDYQKLGMEAPDFILVCEAAQIEYEAYLRLRGRLAEKRAPMVMTGTFEGSIGWYPELFTRWQAANDEEAASFSLPSWENSVIYPGGRDDPEIKRLENQTPHDTFMERYAGVPCKPSGLILSEFSNLIHVGDYKYNPDYPVEIAVDPGSGVPGAYAVLAVQTINGIIYLVAEKYLQGYITEDIIIVCDHDWPWFGKVQRGAIDIYARQKHGMPPIAKQWQDQAGIYLSSKYVEVEAGIDVLRTFLKIHPETGRAKLYVDSSCKGFIAECGGGKSPVFGGGAWIRDMNTGKEKDANNHATKAVIYWLVNRFGYIPRTRESNYGKTFMPDASGRLQILRR